VQEDDEAAVLVDMVEGEEEEEREDSVDIYESYGSVTM
jgi:hypothetical protein